MSCHSNLSHMYTNSITKENDEKNFFLRNQQKNTRNALDHAEEKFKREEEIDVR